MFLMKKLLPPLIFVWLMMEKYYDSLFMKRLTLISSLLLCRVLAICWQDDRRNEMTKMYNESLRMKLAIPLGDQRQGE